MKEAILNLIAVFIGGGIGAILRYLATLCAKFMAIAPIFATFFVNILGCFVIGFIFAITLCRVSFLSPCVKLFLTVGVLGALTTFSTFNLEIFELIKSGKIFSGLIYLFLSCLIGLLVTFLGYKLGFIFFANNYGTGS